MGNEFLEEAIKQAELGLRGGGIPIGSVLVKGNQIIGRGHNKRVQENNPIAHAEIDCLQNAGRVGNYKDMTLYSTLMPCYLCAGAIVQFGIKKLVVGEDETFAGALQFMQNHGVEIVNANDSRCKKMMNEFISENPDLWNEDIGK